MTTIPEEEKPMSRKTSSNYDLEELRREAEEMRDSENAANELKKNLMFDEKEVSIFMIYGHVTEKIDIFFIVLAFIGSLGAGLSMPIMAYISSDLMGDVGNTSEYNDDPLILIDRVENAFNTQIRRFFIFGGISFIANFLCIAFWSLVGSRMCHRLKRQYFTTILSQEQGWFDANNAFEFATKVQAQLEQIEFGVGEKLGLVIQMLASCVISFIFAFIISWKIALVMLCVAPFIIIDILFLVNSLRTGIIMGRKTWEKAGGLAEEMLYNIKTVTSFANFEFETRRFNEKVELCYRLDLGTVFRLAICIGLLIFFLNLSFVIAVLYGRTLIGKDYNENKGKDYTAGDVMCSALCTLMGIMGIGLTAPNIKVIQESCTACSDYFTLYEREPQMDFSQSIERPPRDQVLGKIEFKNVNFYYPSDPNKRMILKNLNITIEPGKKVALVGESGCGKSTTVNLIERLYETTSGEVLIDGIDIKRYDLPYLRSLIGYVQQEPVLFNKPIRDNVIFGRYNLVRELGDPDTLVQNAIEEAYASEFINETKEGLNYVVGIKGGKLSGGQKQRVAIARAIVCEPKILILDEATSALDNKSEKEVQRALDHISERNVTTVIIAHRLSTIKNADLIYAIRDGEVLEVGTHKELLEKGGYYYGLVKAQVGQDEEEKKNDMNLDKKESLKTLTQHLSRTNYKDIQKAHDEVVEKEGVSHGEMFKLLRNNKCDLALGIIGSLFAGGVTPLTGYVLSRAFICIASGHYHMIWHKSLTWCFVFLGVSFLNGFFVFLKLSKLETLGSAITCNMRKEIVEKYLSLHVAYFDIDDNAPGALLTKLSIDTTQLNSIILTLVGDVLSTSGNVITGLILGFIYDWRLSLIALVFIPFIVGAFVIAKDSVRTLTKKKDNRTDIEAGAILSECVINTKTIFSFNFQKPAVDMYLGLLLTESSEYVKDSLWKGFFLGLGAFATYACNATAFYAAKEFILRFTLNFNDFMYASCSLVMMIAGISVGLNGISDYPKAKRAFISVFKTMRTQSLIPPFLRDNQGKIEPENMRGKIEFRNVTFAYPTKPDIDVLKNVSFIIEPGQSAGLVGYSGCGKSTIIQLIERFYDVEDGNGEILIDDINVKDYNIYSLRKRIGLVSQEPVLFKRSVYENILYGRLDASKDEVLAAARAAAIEKFFDKQQMGTKEDPVSGGEKQRLAIARAFLKDPIILLLDEATSALDKESEKSVQQSIDILQKGRTSIAVAHRLSTIQNSSVILVMESGKLVEKGTHEELLALGQKYANLHKYSEQ